MWSPPTRLLPPSTSFTYVQVSEKERGAAVVAQNRPALVPIKRSVPYCLGAHRLVCLLIMSEGYSSNECGEVLGGQCLPSLPLHPLATATGPHWTVWKQRGIKVQSRWVVKGQYVTCVHPLEPAYDETVTPVWAALSLSLLSLAEMFEAPVIIQCTERKEI